MYKGNVTTFLKIYCNLLVALSLIRVHSTDCRILCSEDSSNWPYLGFFYQYFSLSLTLIFPFSINLDSVLDASEFVTIESSMGPLRFSNHSFNLENVQAFGYQEIRRSTDMKVCGEEIS